MRIDTWPDESVTEWLTMLLQALQSVHILTLGHEFATDSVLRLIASDLIVQARAEEWVTRDPGDAEICELRFVEGFKDDELFEELGCLEINHRYHGAMNVPRAWRACLERMIAEMRAGHRPDFTRTLLDAVQQHHPPLVEKFSTHFHR